MITDKTDINNNDIDRLYRCIVNTIMLSCNVILHSGVACWFTSQQATTSKASWRAGRWFVYWSNRGSIIQRNHAPRSNITNITTHHTLNTTHKKKYKISKKIDALYVYESPNWSAHKKLLTLREIKRETNMTKDAWHSRSHAQLSRIRTRLASRPWEAQRTSLKFTQNPVTRSTTKDNGYNTQIRNSLRSFFPV